MKNGILLFFLMIGGGLIRSFSLGNFELHQDEVDLVLSAFTWNRSPVEPPLPAFLTQVYGRVFQSTSPWTVRMPALIYGVLFIPSMYLLGRLVLNPRVGLAAATLAAFSPMAVVHSQLARPYSLFAVLVTFILICFYQAYINEKRSWWIPFALVLTLSFLTHLLTTHVAAGLGLWIGLDLIRKKGRQWKTGVMAFCLIAVSFLVGSEWIWNRNIFVVLDGRYPFSILEFIRLTLMRLGPVYLNKLVFGALWMDILAVLFLTVACAGAIRLVFSGKKTVVLLLSTIVVVSLGIIYFSIGEKAHYGGARLNWGRYQMQLLPVYLLGLACGWDWFFSARLERFRGVSLVVLVICLVPGLSVWFQSNLKDQPNQVKVNAKKIAEMDVRGVILISQNWMPKVRLVSLYSYYRTDRFPTYVEYKSSLYTIRPIKTKFKTDVVLYSKGVPLKAPLPPGRYAVAMYYSRDELDCSRIKKINSIQTCTPLSDPTWSMKEFLLNAGE